MGFWSKSQLIFNAFRDQAKASIRQVALQTHQGLPKRRYRVWSALYNFDCWASDGSTPASRFFRCEFPNLFEPVLGQMDELPRPRKRQAAMSLNV